MVNLSLGRCRRVSSMTTVYKIGVGVILGAWVGTWVTWLTHPYEQCKRMYETPEDISECVWIKENP